MEFTSKKRFFAFIRRLQNDICEALEAFEQTEKFIEDRWEREAGGGGWSRVLKGSTFEKAGVNVSEVFGPVPEVLKGTIPESAKDFYATGISLVIHPVNPMVPTTHANFRYFEVSDENGEIVDRWFGGGADLTPYYLFEEDAAHFHQTLKQACDNHHSEFYSEFKPWCDRYFFNSHRNEHRGIGGVFFDHLRPEEQLSSEALEAFQQEIATSFMEAYIPIVEKRLNLDYTPAQKEWQEIRRGRYVEFNLIHDRGTLFGLKTGGRIESIFMSLPPTVRWEYNHHPAKGTREAALIEALTTPKNWA
jgi:coproporphyrinogen III oxidase